MILQSSNYGLKKTGSTCQVPNDPYAKLMYYINVICNLVPIDKIVPEIAAYRDYENYDELSAQQKKAVVQIAGALSPDKFNGKCIFLAPNLCPDANNEFYELS